MIVNTILILLCSVATLKGNPSPGEDDDVSYSYQYDETQNQEYDDAYGDYDEDDETPQDTADNMVVTHIPFIISRPKHIEVVDGHTISLPCHVDKLPAGLPIIWSKEEQANTNPKIIAIGTKVEKEYKERASVTEDEGGSVLTIGAAKIEDAGEYICKVATQGNQPELYHSVIITDLPSIESSSPEVINVKKGDEVTLKCKGTGSPKPSVKWTRNGKKMPDGEEFIEPADGIVTFSGVTKKHEGTYKCTANNGHGKGVSKLIEVFVHYPPEIEVTEMYFKTEHGNEVNLVCTVHAYPAPTVIWSKDGNKITKGVEKRGSQHTLTLRNINKFKYGQYKCQGENELGNVEETIELPGHAYEPEFKSSSIGSSDTSFLIEWISKSFSPVKMFLLEVRPTMSSGWEEILVNPITEGKRAYHYAGKTAIPELKPATQYVARVSAENGEGWGSPGQEWSFATKGAAPVAKANTSPALSILPNLQLLCILLTSILIVNRS